MSGHRLFFKRFVQFLNTADENLVQQLINPNAQFYVPNQLEAFEGPIGYLQIISMIRSGFSDVQWKLEDVILEKDKQGIRFSLEPKFNGSLVEKVPTEKSVKTQAVNTYRLASNQFIRIRG